MIRSYIHSDFDAVINLFDLNVPKDFSQDERFAFINYLNHELEVYFVFEKDKKICGAAGINFGFNHGKTARLSWAMIHPQFQKKGLGTRLLKHRIAFIQQFKHVKRIQVRTSQTAYQFYKKNGFRIEQIVKDYWTEGFDLYDMSMKTK